jgi:hypothetical protein
LKGGKKKERKEEREGRLSMHAKGGFLSSSGIESHESALTGRVLEAPAAATAQPLPALCVANTSGGGGGGNDPDD